MSGLRRATAEPRSVLAGVARRISEHGLTDRAAALTYYGFLSLFPALIVGVSLLGLIGDYPETYRDVISTLREVAPGTVVDTIDSALRDALRSRGTAGGLLGVGILLAFYSASSGTGAALRGIGAVYGAPRASPWWRGYLARLELTVVVGALVLVAFAAMLLAGPLFSEIAAEAGVKESVSNVISLIRWPIGVAALVASALLLYRKGAARPVGFHDLWPGAIAAGLLWVMASLGFNFYVSNFGSYDATYGSLGAVIVLLVWMWIGNLALLAGAALNVELEEP